MSKLIRLISLGIIVSLVIPFYAFADYSCNCTCPEAEVTELCDCNCEIIEEEPVPEEETIIEVDPENIFTDVQKGHPEYTALKYLKEKGIIKGYEDGSFKPGNLINRVEALKIILEANKAITASYIDQNKIGGADFRTNDELMTFSDIIKSSWYYPYLKKAVVEELIVGYQDGTFKPGNTINRVESLKLIMESDNVVLPEVTENVFADVYADDWFAPYMLEGKNREIIYFTMQNTANPGRELTRSRFAELVYRYLRSKENIKFGKASYYADYFDGRSTSSGEIFRQSEMTAAHLTLPFGTMVRVTNLSNGESVDVRINDRGPYITGRILDLSRSAFESIGHTGSGVMYIQYEILN